MGGRYGCNHVGAGRPVFINPATAFHNFRAMKKTEEIEKEYDDVITHGDGSRSFELSNGKMCVVREGRGKHMKNAQRIAGTDKSAYMGALMSLLVKIDDESVTMEELEELPLRDYMKMMAVFTDVNF